MWFVYRWEKSFVEVAQPDFHLRRVLTFHDLHISLGGKNAPDAKTSFPLVERTFVACRFLTKFDGSDCRGCLASVINVLCDELHISVTDHQLPMVRRLVEFVIAFQAGVFNSRLKHGSNADLTTGSAEAEDLDLFADPMTEPPTPVAAPSPSSSWTSWALSLIPAIPNNNLDGDSGPAEVVDEGRRNQPLPAKATSFAAYSKKLTVTFSVS